MSVHRILAAICLLVTLAALSAPSAAAADLGSTLTEAQGLYTQAAYEQALALLDRLDPRAATLEEGQAIRRYRALCFVALGRSADATKIVEEMVQADPAAGVDQELPPRLQLLVRQVRERVVGDVVRQAYERGRDLYDHEQFAAAATEFTRVLKLLDDRSLELTKEPSFVDLRLIADGFVKLSKAAAVPPPPAAPAVAPAVAPKAVAEPAPVRSAEPAFVAPVPIAQEIPPFPRSAGAGFMAKNEGDLDVDVGIDGRVTGARIVSSIHPVYDVILTGAARTWRYQPARRYGEPVAYTKRVHVVLQAK
jgi:tetratricopeptide (TPR) repeat protein